MGENEPVDDSKGFRKFLKNHSIVFAVFVVAAVLAIAGAIYVFLWFVGNAQSTGLVPSTLAQWTMGNIVAFILHVIFWELLLIGIPVGIGAVIGWQWWKRIPDEEKREYRFFGKRSRATGGGGGFSLFFFIAFCIKVFIDGNWNVAISSWTVDYVVGSMVTILVWVAVIFGIPAAIGLVWWINHEMKKK